MDEYYYLIDGQDLVEYEGYYQRKRLIDLSEKIRKEYFQDEIIRVTVEPFGNHFKSLEEAVKERGYQEIISIIDEQSLQNTITFPILNHYLEDGNVTTVVDVFKEFKVQVRQYPYLCELLKQKELINKLSLYFHNDEKLIGTNNQQIVDCLNEMNISVSNFCYDSFLPFGAKRLYLIQAITEGIKLEEITRVPFEKLAKSAQRDSRLFSQILKPIDLAYQQAIMTEQFFSELSTSECNVKKLVMKNII